MRGGNPSLDPIQQLQQRVDDAHSQIKTSAPQAVENIKTMPSVGNFNNGINNFTQHIRDINNGMVNLGPDVANSTYEDRDNMMKSLNDAVALANQGNYPDAVKSVDLTKTHMANAINSASTHMTGRKQLSDAGLGDHAVALTDKMKKNVSHYQGRVNNLFSRFRGNVTAGGGYTRKRKSKDPNYHNRRYEISSSHSKYNKYHNRLLKHHINRHSKRK